MLSAPQALSWLLAGVFMWAGFLNLSGPRFVRDEFAKWGYPPSLRRAVGIVEIAAAAMLPIPETRSLGACLALVVLLGVMISLIKSREWLRLEYPVVLIVIAAITAAL